MNQYSLLAKILWLFIIFFLISFVFSSEGEEIKFKSFSQTDSIIKEIDFLGFNCLTFFLYQKTLFSRSSSSIKQGETDFFVINYKWTSIKIKLYRNTFEKYISLNLVVQGNKEFTKKIHQKEFVNKWSAYYLCLINDNIVGDLELYFGIFTNFIKNKTVIEYNSGSRDHFKIGLNPPNPNKYENIIKMSINPEKNAMNFDLFLLRKNNIIKSKLINHELLFNYLMNDLIYSSDFPSLCGVTCLSYAGSGIQNSSCSEIKNVENEKGLKLKPLSIDSEQSHDRNIDIDRIQLVKFINNDSSSFNIYSYSISFWLYLKYDEKENVSYKEIFKLSFSSDYDFSITEDKTFVLRFEKTNSNDFFTYTYLDDELNEKVIFSENLSQIYNKWVLVLMKFNQRNSIKISISSGKYDEFIMNIPNAYIPILNQYANFYFPRKKVDGDEIFDIKLFPEVFPESKGLVGNLFQMSNFLSYYKENASSASSDSSGI